MVRLVWIGAVIMALGGMLAVFGRRQRGPVTENETLPLAVARSRSPA
jgi:cytochrome c biogenesis factor